MQFEADGSMDLLEELIVKGRLDEKEQEALRLTAVLQISANAAKLPGLMAQDHRLLALLLARWGFALTDVEQSVDGLTDAFEVSTTSLGRALDADVNAVEESLERLASAHQIGFQPMRSSGVYEIDLTPTFNDLGATLARTLYREFIEREGQELRDAAEFYVESIRRDLDELSALRPGDPRVCVLANDYQAFEGRSSIEELMKAWLDQPRSVYAWFKELAEFEERHAILSGTPCSGLQTELAKRAGKKILILGRQLAPPSAPAKAA